MAKKQPELQYEERAKLDAELEAAVGEILSAEEEARRIIETAEASAKSIQLDGAARERDLRTHAVKQAAADKVKAIADAEARADEECARMKSDAEKAGAKLVESKRKAAAARADELFRMLGGK